MILIDAEPDLDTFPLDDPSPWYGMERFAEETGRLRDSLSARTGEAARLCWFMRLDPQIELAYGTPTYPAERFDRFWDEARSAGDALGPHAQAWRWNDREQTWSVELADRDYVEYMQEMSFDAFETAFGEPAIYQRFGFRFMSNDVMNLARDRGVRVDLTLEPGEPAVHPGLIAGRVWTGVVPDQTDVPRGPYQPDPTDFTRRGTDPTDPLWTFPLSSGRFVPAPTAAATAQAVPTATARTLRRARHPVKTMKRLVAGAPPPKPGLARRRVPYSTLSVAWEWRSPADFWDSAFAAVDDQELPYLALGLRTDVLAYDDRRRRFHEIMQHLETDPRASRLVFTTPEDALHRMGLLEVAGS